LTGVNVPLFTTPLRIRLMRRHPTPRFPQISRPLNIRRSSSATATASIPRQSCFIRRRSCTRNCRAWPASGLICADLKLKTEWLNFNDQGLPRKPDRNLIDRGNGHGRQGAGGSDRYGVVSHGAAGVAGFGQSRRGWVGHDRFGRPVRPHARKAGLLKMQSRFLPSAPMIYS